MHITQLKNVPELIDYQEVKIGKLYFFEKFLVTEFNEGVHIDFESFSETKNAILEHYKTKEFGVITNRVNTYSLDLNDANRFNESFTTLKAYAVVCNTLFGKGVFEIENQFFKYNRRIFEQLDKAISWVESEIQ